MLHTIQIANPIVISVGGALISPSGGLDIKFLTDLNTLIRKQVSAGQRFLLIAGGGKTCRDYRDAGKAIIQTISNDDLDWLGIHATRLNGHLLRTIFKDISHHRMIENYNHKLDNWTEAVAIGAGWKPGHSSDYCAVYLAYEYGAKVVVNLSNIDYVYSHDPKIDPKAKPLIKASWKQVQDLMGTEWVPGMNLPFDPIASQFASKHKLTVIVANGNPLNNLEHILNGTHFKGTVISDK